MLKKMISQESLVCFMEDLQGLLLYFKKYIPCNLHFINIASIYSFMNMQNPEKFARLEGIMEVLEPFIPLIVSPKNLEEVVNAYEGGDSGEFAELEEGFLLRSQFVFINSIMAATDRDWENIVDICMKIREIKLHYSGII